jgi:hypothetical protein
MKLRAEPFGLEPRLNFVDAIGDDQRWTFVTLREEVTHGAIKAASHANLFSFASDEGEGAVDLANGSRRTIQDSFARFIGGHVVNLVGSRIEKIDDAFDVLVHEKGLNGGRGDVKLALCPGHGIFVIAMGRLKMRGSSFDPQRLGELLAKAKAGLTSEAEETELLQLLTAARRLSDQNTKTVAEIRASDTPKKPKSHAKSS